jgi:hypothetical protein
MDAGDLRASVRRLSHAALAALALSLLAATALTASASAASAGPVGVKGNRLVGRHGHTVRLLGVDRSGTEYACVVGGGYGFTDSPDYTQADSKKLIKRIRSWHVNAVRVPLNEACWLDINGVHSGLGGRPYRRKVATTVHRLEHAGIHPILDLHVVDPRSYPARKSATGLRPAPDASHAPDFWRSVANRYGHDRAVLYDLYNEPNDIGWRCLRDGCKITRDAYSSDVPHYRSAGTRQLVHVIRRAGARNVIMVPGLDYTSNLSKWRRFRPHDPLHRLAASLHTYEAPLGGCDPNCRRRVLAPLARHVPIITGEFGDTDCNHDYSDAYMRWADRHGVSYLGWTWDATAPGSWTCDGGPSLIENYRGKPTGYGLGLRNHLRKLRG